MIDASFSRATTQPSLPSGSGEEPGRGEGGLPLPQGWLIHPAPAPAAALMQAPLWAHPPACCDLAPPGSQTWPSADSHSLCPKPAVNPARAPSVLPASVLPHRSCDPPQQPPPSSPMTLRPVIAAPTARVAACYLSSVGPGRPSCHPEGRLPGAPGPPCGEGLRGSM